MNNTKANFPKDKCIHILFEEQAKLTPDSIALEFNGNKLTYGELNSKANQLGNYLRKIGIDPEKLVGVCVERSIEMVICLLGILKSGGAYVPIDPNYPEERISFLLNDSNASVLITQDKFFNKLYRNNSKVICIDKEWKDIEHEKKNNLVNLSVPENSAYIIYTSGSTGQPKGVIGIHSSSINRFHWMWETFPFEPTEILCQKTSLSFVDSIWEIFGPLLKGINIIIISDEILKDPFLLIKFLVEKKISRIVLVPSLLRTILDAYDKSENNLSHLKYWFSSGEALTMDLFNSFNEKLSPSKLTNLYGSSEVAADVTFYDTGDLNNLTYIPLGKPINNCEVYILDPDLNPVQIGEPGELYVAGECLARGYLNRPELTCEKFIPNPFAEEKGLRLYKTGDIVRLWENGNIEYKGRIDHQVKIRGFRVELGEIEAGIGSIPDISECIVIAKDDMSKSKYLIAYLVVGENNTIKINEVRKFLIQRFPEFMIPSEFIILDKMPLTPNGKIDRNSLPAHPQNKFSEEKQIIPPSTTTEEVLLQIWSEVLNREKISIEDDFFEIGGHSLLATQIISRIRKTFEIEFPLKIMFDKSNIKELAEAIEEIIVKEINEMSDEEANRLINQVI